MIYLDNAATAKPSEAAVAGFLEGIKNFGNPSSLYRLGIESERLIRSSRSVIAKSLGTKPANIFFTSGGTESDNTAIFGTARAYKKFGKHIITTKIEHPAVTEAFKRLEEDGFEADYLNVDTDGVISLDELESLLRPDTILVSVMLVNNETGMIQPVDKIKAMMRERSPRALLHTDAVQGYGKIPVTPEKWGVDLLSASGHKIHAVKGTGILYAGRRIAPYILGGGQQEGMRSGTQSAELACSLAAAVSETDPVKDMTYMKALRERLKQRITEDIDRIRINGADENNAGSILNVSFLGVRSEILLHYLEGEDIYVSTGSACSSHKPQKSHVLAAMGRTDAEIDGAVRFSFSRFTTMEEIEKTADALKKYVAQVRKYTGR